MHHQSTASIHPTEALFHIPTLTVVCVKTGRTSTFGPDCACVAQSGHLPIPHAENIYSPDVSVFAVLFNLPIEPAHHTAILHKQSFPQFHKVAWGEAAKKRSRKARTVTCPA